MLFDLFWYGTVIVAMLSFVMVMSSFTFKTYFSVFGTLMLFYIFGWMGVSGFIGIIDIIRNW